MQTQPADVSSYYSTKLLNSKQSQDPKVVGGLFEAIFYRQILHEVRQSSLSDGLLEGGDSQQVKQMFHEELANHMGQLGHLGIQKMIEEHIETFNSKNTIHPKDFHLLVGNQSKSKGLLKDLFKDVL